MPSGRMFIAPARLDDPAQALAHQTYRNGIEHLREALQRFAAGEDFEQHGRACHPFVRVHTATVARSIGASTARPHQRPSEA